MPIKTYGIGYRSAEKQAFLRKRTYKRNGTRPGIICAPGRGAGAIQPVSPNYFSYVTYKLAAAGFPVFSIDAGTTLYEWGSSNSVAAIVAAKTYLQNTLGAKTGGVFTLGISMGNLSLLNFQRANPGDVLAHLGVIPAVDLAKHYAQNTPSSATSQISTAYGGAPPSTSNPAQSPSEVTKPTLFYTASNDPSCPPQWTADFAAAVGSTCEVRNLGAVGHYPGTVPADEILEFFEAHA